ncbi:2-hydroxyacid dehydrogenase [Consotaella aegiceratis]|uniref:2-hydroxyacid dehydrogenase n=1 Tax=Consotaella aegiceratis TaxID=3097961 RepID=UPI002F4129D9
MSELKSIPILVSKKMNVDTLATLRETFDVRPFDGNPASLGDEDRHAVRGIALAGGAGAALMDALPNLEIIASFGVGYDGVDVAAAAARRVLVTNTPDVLTEEVADTTLGLLLNTVREFSKAERYLRDGRWETDGPYPLTPMTLRGRSAGIFGLGRIGLAIARRLEAFGLTVSYHNRRQRDDVPYPYHASLADLAAAVDTLIVAAPGGPATENAVGPAVLEALGPNGVLINIGRGTTVDEAALVKALASGTIGAAGLDVFVNEPKVSADLRALDNVVLLPHLGSASRATRWAMGDVVVNNLKMWFQERRVVTPVPEIVAAGLVEAG